ncbi:MAG: hypothetical protein JSV88_14415, partial [Candidatus Aminicenantes bacterium]
MVCASCNRPPADEDRQIKTLSNQTDQTGQNQAGNDYLRDHRLRMVRLLQFYGIKDKRVLTTMEKVRRHMYIPENYRWRVNAYGDHPCPIGYGQTISQPFIVAYMTEKMKV